MHVTLASISTLMMANSRVVAGAVDHFRAVANDDVRSRLDRVVRTAEDAQRCVSYLKYPPSVLRGWGPFVAHSRHQTSLFDYAGSVGPEIACGLLLETVEAVENIDEILRVPGIDFVVPAQFDLSTALGVSGQFDAPAFVEAITTLERAVASSQLPAGCAALTAEQTSSLIVKGYRILLQASTC
jgi:4-hydroxy-2-oxoheptanedioate aldolase